MIPRGYRKRLTVWGGELALGWLRVEGLLAAAVGLRRRYFGRLARAVRRTGLFDADWYLDTNPDVSDSGIDPLLHYVRFGDAEGRAPMPLFDPGFYREHAKPARTVAPNSLLHFCHVGHLLKHPASAWFDTEYYLRQNRDIARARMNPLRHYLRSGGIEGRSPCRQFDAGFYLRMHPELATARINPLLHYLRMGRLEGHAITSADGGPNTKTVEANALAPQGACPLEDLRPCAVTDEPLVDVVIPVYGGRIETLRCVRSVLESRNRTPFELIVIDDASPDQELAATLERYAGAGLYTLLRNDANLGFVATANRGLGLHAGRDVVLLNSDTEVFGDWLDRLRATAHADARTATVTPLSNNATIASYPRTVHDNPYPLEISYAELDRLAASVNAGASFEAPTGIGFCMYLRRDCIAEVGIFDEPAFGRGYGEENDFCQRAIAAGWRNLIAADTFVLHLGSVSFRGERNARIASAMRMLDRRHPAYRGDVQRFIAADPLASARRSLDWARLKRAVRGRNVLMVCHSRGGGAERYIGEDTERLLGEGVGVFYLRPVRGSPGRVRIGDPRRIELHNIPGIPLDAADGELATMLAELGINAIHVHSTIDFDSSAAAQLVEIAQRIGASLEVEIHDYQVICPRINLVDDRGHYCGEPPPRRCNECLAARGSRFGALSIERWRDEQGAMLRAAERVWVPNADVRARLQHYFSDIRVEVAPHEQLDSAGIAIREPELNRDEPLRVAVIGAIGKVKGYDVLLECARAARAQGLPLSFSLLGYSMDDARLKSAGVAVSGRYLENEGMERLQAIGPHVAWLPSIWPETYSYTLSMALRASLPVFAFDIGAIAARLDELGLARFRMPLALSRQPHEVNAVFMRYRERRAAWPVTIPTITV